MISGQYEQANPQENPPNKIRREYSVVAPILALLAERQKYQPLIDQNAYKSYSDRR